MVSKGRHPKKSIADALADVARDGLDVLEVHRGHRWGVLVCTVCGAELALWSSPRVPEDAAKRGAPLRRSPPPRGGVMHTHEFTFVLASKPTGEELDVLFEIGGGDATPETTGDGTSWLHFDREADSLAAALVSALGTVERAGLQVVAVRSDDLVTLRELAQRTSRSYESVRLLAAGKRGPGGFPAPLSTDGWTLYSWAQVRPWFARHYPTRMQDRDELTFEHDRVIAAADHLVRARAILRGDDTVTQLAKLLAVA
jgi:hypothetical protein